MELLLLLALALLGLSVLIRRRGRRAPAPAPAPPAPAVLHKVTDPAVAHRVLIEDADTFANRPLLPFFVELAKKRGGQRNENVSNVPYGPQWRVLRRNITSETLHPSRLGLGHLEPLQREAIQDLVAALHLQSACDGGKELRLADHLRTAIFRVVARLCFGDGVDEGRVRAVCAQVHGMQVAIGEVNPFTGSSVLAKLAEWRYQRHLLGFHARITELCIPIIAARRRRTHDDGLCRPYVDTLVELRVPDGGGKHGGRRALSDDEIVDLVFEFLGAGSGSLVASLQWTLAHLVARPDVQEKLRREVDGVGDRSQLLLRSMPYLHAVILESLRMHPPAPVAMRQVQADEAAILQEGGTTTIPAHSDVTVLFLLGDMGRHGKTWNDPDEFRPERFLVGGEAEGVGPLPSRKEMKMMPFGAGHRFCPGVGLAMATMKSFLAALVREFEWVPLPDDAVVDLTELDGFLKTMKTPLSARLTRRSPSSF